MKARVMGLNLGYILKSSLLFTKLHRFLKSKSDQKGNFDVFWNGGMPSWQKLGQFSQKKGVQKLSTPKVVLLI